MAQRTTNFPDAPEIRAFRAVESILRDDPSLVNAGVKFRAWDGERADGQPPSSGQCPMLRISPEITQADAPRTQSMNTAHFAIKVELHVNGTIADDLVNFWGAVRAALVRSKPFRGSTVQCYLQQQAGVTRSMVTMPGFGSWQSSTAPENGLRGVGRIEIELLVNA